MAVVFLPSLCCPTELNFLFSCPGRPRWDVMSQQVPHIPTLGGFPGPYYPEQAKRL